MSIKTELKSYLNPIANFQACCNAKTKCERIRQLGIGILKSFGYLLVAPALIGAALLLGIYVKEKYCPQKTKEIQKPKTASLNETRQNILHNQYFPLYVLQEKKEFTENNNVQIVESNIASRIQHPHNCTYAIYLKMEEKNEVMFTITYSKKHGLCFLKDTNTTIGLFIEEDDADNVPKFVLNVIAASDKEIALKETDLKFQK